jgi:TonB family protein
MLRLSAAWLWSFGVHFLLVLAITGYFLSGRLQKTEEIPIELQLSDVHVHHPEEVRHKGPPDLGAPVARSETGVGTGEHPAAIPEDLPSNDLSGMNAGQRNEYLSRLIRLISSKKSYPRASILNEEQGVVQVRVTLGPGGKVMGVERVSSSGFARLDEAAVETLRAFESLPLPPGYPEGVRLLIPIRFEINPGH